MFALGAKQTAERILLLKQKIGAALRPPFLPSYQTLVNAHVLSSRHYTPLHLAAETGNADIVNALLFAGADVLATNCPRNVGVPGLFSDWEGDGSPISMCACCITFMTRCTFYHARRTGTR